MLLSIIQVFISFLLFCFVTLHFTFFFYFLNMHEQQEAALCCSLQLNLASIHVHVIITSWTWHEIEKDESTLLKYSITIMHKPLSSDTNQIIIIVLRASADCLKWMLTICTGFLLQTTSRWFIVHNNLFSLIVPHTLLWFLLSFLRSNPLLYNLCSSRDSW